MEPFGSLRGEISQIVDYFKGPEEYSERINRDSGKFPM
jgi:hypothetical protein